jgi:hypothetical protein
LKLEEAAYMSWPVAPSFADKATVLRVLVKPLGGASLEDYLEAVPRDRRDSPLQ